MQPWAESNRNHATNKREDSALDALETFETGLDFEPDTELTDEEYQAYQLEKDYDDYEAAQLHKLDEIMDGDWPEHPLY